MNIVILRDAILLFSLLGCSLYSSYEYPSFAQYEQITKKDYLDHLESFGKVYLETPGNDRLQLSPQSENYLLSIYKKFLKNNEILLDRKIPLRFFVIRAEKPFHFSLPRGQIVFSTELIKSYLESENLFLCAFAFEVIKSHRNVYPKKMFIPKGFLLADHLLEINTIPFDAKAELDKWAYLTMKRAGYDNSAYLIWLKTQNKNSFEFAKLLKGRNISKEEFVFKNFLVKELNERNNIEIEETGEGNSSKGYYNFLMEIRKKSS